MLYNIKYYHIRGCSALIIVGELFFKRGLKKQSSPNSHDNYVSWSHFKDKYITYHLRPGNPLKSCPKEIIESRIGTYPLVPESD